MNGWLSPPANSSLYQFATPEALPLGVVFLYRKVAFSSYTRYAPPPKRKSPGFFTLLLGFLAAFSSLSKPKKKHSGRCDGDCANGPPHYGYRYGRWYYGHDHAHGCEFGGNKCSGSRD